MPSPDDDEGHKFWKKVLFLHLGQTGALISWNTTASSPYPDMEGMVPGVSLPPGYRTLSTAEAASVMSRYDALLNRPEVRFQHRYEAGDLLLVDNLAVAHRADAAAADARGALRLLHRSTVRGVRNLHAEGLPSFLYIFGDNPDCEGSEGLWQSAESRKDGGSMNPWDGKSMNL
eukprot:s2046_g1.t1